MNFFRQLWRSWFPIPHEWDLKNSSIITPSVFELRLNTGKETRICERVIIVMECKRCGAHASLYPSGDLFPTRISCK